MGATEINDLDSIDLSRFPKNPSYVYVKFKDYLGFQILVRRQIRPKRSSLSSLQTVKTDLKICILLITRVEVRILLLSSYSYSLGS